MSVLIIGGTGFLGAACVRKLIEMGKKVVCFDLYPDERKVDSLTNAIVVKGDVTQIKEISSVIKKYGIKKIINLAYLLLKESEDNPQLALKVNIQGMNNVFEAARLAGIKRVVYPSSNAAYGLQSSFGEKKVKEEDNLFPTTIYGACKAFNEFMAQKYNSHWGMSIVALRAVIVFGLGRKTGLTTWASNYAVFPAVNKPLRFPFKSTQKVCLVHKETAALMLTTLCLTKTLNHFIYNSGGYSLSFSELAEIIKKFVPEAEISFDEQAKELPVVYLVDGSRIRKELKIELPSLEKMVRSDISLARKQVNLPGIQRK